MFHISAPHLLRIVRLTVERIVVLLVKKTTTLGSTWYNDLLIPVAVHFVAAVLMMYTLERHIDDVSVEVLVSASVIMLVIVLLYTVNALARVKG